MENLELRPRDPDERLPRLPDRERFHRPYDQSETIDLDASGNPETGSVPGYWRAARRHKIPLLLAALAGLGGGILLSISQTPVYQARASLEIQGINQDFLSMRDLNPNDTTNPNFPEVDLQTQVKILQSQTLIQRVVDTLKVDDRVPDEQNIPLPIWRKTLKIAPPAPVSPRDRIVTSAADDLKVRSQPNTRIIEVRYDAADPRFAADFANTLVSQFIEQTLESRWRATEHTGEWLARQMQDLKTKLEQSERQLQDYAEANGLRFTSEKDNIAEDKLRQVQTELSNAQNERITRQSRYELASSAPAEALPEVLDDDTLRRYQVQLTDLRRQAAELTSTLTPENPKVVKLQAQANLLESAIENERGNVTRRIRNEYESARRREALLQAHYEAQARLLSTQAARVAHYGILKREVDSTRQIYESMLQRVKEAAVGSALRASNIRVIDAAVTPKHPYKPSKPLNAGLGVLAGLFAGFAVILARDRTNRRIGGPGDVRTCLALPELGTIPGCDSRVAERLLRQKSNGSLMRLLPAGEEGKEQQPFASRVELVTHQQRLSMAAECFRSVLTSILLAGRNGDRPRVLAVTSAMPGDGKTMVTSNLGIALADSGMKVLLVDGDFRKPRLHAIFEIENTTGLSDFLVKANEAQLAGFMQRTRLPRLSILPSGSACDPDLIHSPALAELLGKARADFDMVLIDTPPMLLIPDARILARYADAAVVVVRSGQTNRDAALTACERLSEDGSRLLGIVVNDWKPNSDDRYGYGKYYKSYRRHYSRT